MPFAHAPIRAPFVYTPLEMMQREHERFVQHRRRWCAEIDAVNEMLSRMEGLPCYEQTRKEVVEKLDEIHLGLFGVPMREVTSGDEAVPVVAASYRLHVQATFLNLGDDAYRVAH